MGDFIPTSVPIAIVGIACRFAGDATDPEKLWTMLEEGRNAWSEIPKSRFNLDGWYHPDRNNASTTDVRGGHFLKEDLDLFDATFFNFSSETAATLDPQYRLLLESVFEALENAGIPLERAAGSKTSVFSGAFFHDYQDGLMRDTESLPRFLMTGNGSAMASNRVSHFFDLKGPSMTVDTGCSTTLTALHQACQSLKSGDADMSIVGGSNLLINPDFFVSISSLGMLSPDGKSYSFDSRANGYGRGEGVATVIIKRLEDAIKAGDPIRAVIRETQLNQDGKTETITSPSSDAQEQLIRSCYQRARIDPRSIQYFEAHGTGTPTGDPIEARTIASVFKDGRSQGNPLYIGSVKTNLGHTEPTSGLASIIKVALSLERGIIPPSVNFDKPNPQLQLDDWNLSVPRECEPWDPGSYGIRRASVNNFGYGGANAHVILEEWPASSHSMGLRGNQKNGDNNKHLNGANGHTDAVTLNIKRTDDDSARHRVFVLSAKDEYACRKMAGNLKEYLQRANCQAGAEGHLLDNLAYTLASRRSRFSWTLTYSKPAVSELIQALGNEKIKPIRHSGDQPRIGFVFTGQGAQWYAMGRELIDVYPTYRASLLEAEEYLKEFGYEWSLIAELSRDAKSSRIAETEMSLPLCSALQISLVNLLASWNIQPVAVSSHSSGEIAAAYTAGAITFREAMFACSSRSAVSRKLSSVNGAKVSGGMLAVGLGVESAEQWLVQVQHGKAVVACVNSPTSVTISGDVTALDELEAMLTEKNIFARRLRVKTAFHSHHMQSGFEPYIKELQGMGFAKSNRNLRQIIYASPTTGGRIDDAGAISSPVHWAKSMVQRVLFVDAFTAMALDPSTGAAEVDAVIEVGPHAALSGPIADITTLPAFKDVQISYLSCLVRNSNAVETMQAMACQLLQKGFAVDMRAVNFPEGEIDLRVLRDLPPYPWNHQISHWSEPRTNRAHRAKQFPHHDLLGSLVKGANMSAPTWVHTIRPSSLPWVRDHTVQSDIVYPGAGFICMALEAARQLSEFEGLRSILGFQLRDIDIQQALVIPSGSEGIEVHVSLRPVSEKAIGTQGWKEFQILSASLDNSWTLHSSGLITVALQAQEDETVAVTSRTQSLRTPMPSYARAVDPAEIYAGMRDVGIYHGPVFQNLTSVHVAEQRSVSTVTTADIAAVMPARHYEQHVLHPTTLDTVFVSAYAALMGTNTRQSDPKVPKTIKNLWISNDSTREVGHAFRSYAQVISADSKSFQSNVCVVDDTDSPGMPQMPFISLEGLVCQSLGAALPRELDSSVDDICSTLAWVPDFSFVDVGRLSKKLSLPIDPQEAEIIMDLRRACFHYSDDAISNLSMADIQQLEWHHKRFFTWMKLQIALALSNDLGEGSSEWHKDSLDTKQALLERVRTASVNGEVVVRLGPQIGSMLRRELTPLELLMQDKLLYKYYKEGLKFDRANIQLGDIVNHLVRQNPRGKILEIGGGTGGTTSRVLPKIGNGKKSGFGPYASEYHFTDISSGFFGEAQEQFADWSDIMTYRKLDIEIDPESQGFEYGTYDLIVACQVLHATKNMHKTMTHVRKLLKPGGKLVMMETTQDQVDMQFVFGLLPGWWLSEEEERRLSPNMQAAHWQRILTSTGFSGLDIDLHDCDSDDFYSFSVLVTTAVPGELGNSNAPLDDILILSSRSRPGSTNACNWLGELQQSIVEETGARLPAIDTLDTVAASGAICVFLDELDRPLLEAPSDAEFTRIRTLALSCKTLLWVTRGGTVDCEHPNVSLSSGFLRSLRQENVGRSYYALDLDPKRSGNTAEDAKVIAKVLATVVTNANGREFEYAERSGDILLPRMIKDFERNRFIARDADVQAQPGLQVFNRPGRLLQLDVGTPGLLETLAFRDVSDAASDMPAAFLEVEPKAFGLNFRDVMVAMGRLDEKVMGLECSGIVTRVGAEAASHGFKVGDSVFALLTGQYTNRAQVPWMAAGAMPAGMDFETAASIPMVFATAYIALYEKARIAKGQTVLIHAATGGVGQAAIMLAQLVGVEVFATAGTAEKRRFLSNTFGIPAENIWSSRDSSFSSRLMAKTGGRGVDVVLNSLSGMLLQQSFNCVAPFGHFVEIGKFDTERNSNLEMAPFSRAASFTAIDLLALLKLQSLDIHRALTSVARLLEQKLVRPVGPVSSYPLAHFHKAFRQMQTGKHMGKIVLSVTAEELVPVRPSIQSVRLRPDATYLIAGGVGGIGRSAAVWMLDHGARNIVLISRSAAAGGRTASFISELQEAYPDGRIRAISCDISDHTALDQVLLQCLKELPPIRGVLQAAMVLQDSILDNMTIDAYRAAVRPKVQGSWNLHELLGRDLDFFVMLSSLAGIFGQASQSNYTAGGAFQDALARHRVAKGQPGVAIDVGAVKDVGYVASNKAVLDRMVKAGHRLLSEDEVLSAIESAILNPCPQILLGINTGPSAEAADTILAREIRFDALRYRKSAKGGESGSRSRGSGANDLAGQLASALSVEEASQLVLQALGRKLMDIFMISEEEVVGTKSMASFGVDSLVAVELRNMLALQACAVMSVFDILQSSSLATLADLVVSKSTLVTL